MQILLFYSFNSNSMPLSLEKIENLDCYNVIVIVIMLFSLKTREKKFQPFHLVGKSASCKTLMTSGFNPYYGNKLNIKRLGLCDTSAPFDSRSTKVLSISKYETSSMYKPAFPTGSKDITDITTNCTFLLEMFSTFKITQHSEQNFEIYWSCFVLSVHKRIYFSKN